MRACAACLLVASVAAGCGGPQGGEGLHGSICTVYDCTYDTLTIRDVSSGGTMTTIQIDYTQGPVNEAVKRAAVVVCDVSSFVKGQPLPLSSARHIAPDGVDFPTLTQGTCTFDSDLAVGSAVKGSFQAVFTTEAGTQRALYGEFEGTLEDAEL